MVSTITITRKIKRNKVIHVICVPIIVFSLFGLLQFINFAFAWEAHFYAINIPFFVAIVVSALYLYVEWFCGVK